MKTTRKTLGRAALTAAAAVFSLLLIASIAALVYAARDMRHEGLTYSQWYEGSIRGFYACLMLAIAVFAGFVLSWFFLLRRPASRAPRRARKKALGLLSGILAAAAAGLFVLSLLRRGALLRAQAENTECLAPYLFALGNSLTPAVACLAGALGTFLCGVLPRPGD